MAAEIPRWKPKRIEHKGLIGKGSGSNKGKYAVWEYTIYFECDSEKTGDHVDFEFKLRMPLEDWQEPTRFGRFAERIAEMKMLSAGIPVDAKDWSKRTLAISEAGRTKAKRMSYRIINKTNPWVWPHKRWGTIGVPPKRHKRLRRKRKR